MTKDQPNHSGKKISAFDDTKTNVNESFEDSSISNDNPDSTLVSDKKLDESTVISTTKTSSIVPSSDFASKQNKILQSIIEELQLSFVKDIFSIESDTFELLYPKFEKMQTNLVTGRKWICDECFNFWIEVYVISIYSMLHIHFFQSNL